MTLSSSLSPTTVPSTIVPGYNPDGLRLALDYAAPAGHHIQSRHDVIAVSLHACFSIVGFHLVAISDANDLDQPIHGFEYPLPPQWNTNSLANGTFFFKYRHTESSLLFLVKLVVMGSSILAHAMTVQDNKVFNETFIPSTLLNPGATFPTDVNSNTTMSSLITSDDASVSPFMDKVKNLIISLAPNLSQQGFDPLSSSQSTQTSSSLGDFGPSRQPRSTAIPHSHPHPISPITDIPPFGGFVSPYSIGHDDLDPLGGMPPLGPYPFGDRRLGPGLGPFGGDTGGGSILGPGHPLFTGSGIGHSGPPRYWGGDQYLPPGAVPPGARFDPIGPSGIRPPPFTPGPGRGRGRGGASFPSGEPDNDEFMPPGPGINNRRGRGGDLGGYGGFPDMYM